jgi:hypothetical protein
LREIDALLLADALPHRRRTAVSRVELPLRRISVPVLGGTHTLLRNLRLVPGRRWRRKFMAALDHAHAGLPYHAILRDDVASVISDAVYLADMNRALLMVTLRALRLPLPTIAQSDWAPSDRAADSTARGEYLGSSVLTHGFNVIRLAHQSPFPAGLAAFCETHPLKLERTLATSAIAQSMACASIYTLIARWGPDTAHQLQPILDAPASEAPSG